MSEKEYINNLFLQLNEIDRLANEIAWNNLAEDYSLAASECLASLENAGSPEAYESINDEALVNAYYANLYSNYSSLCALQ